MTSSITSRDVHLQRIYICLATTLNIIILARSLAYPRHEEDDPEGGDHYPGGSFLTAFPLFLNLCVLAGTLLVIANHGRYNHGVRVVGAFAGCTFGLLVALYPLLMIMGHHGCTSEYYSKVAAICYCHEVVAFSTLTWVVALGWEAVLSCTRQRDEAESKTVDSFEYASLI